MQKILDLANTQVGLYIVVALFGAIGSVATWSLKKLGNYAHAAAQTAGASNDHVLQTMLLNATSMMASCANDAVNQVENTLRPMLLGAAANGKLTPEQGAALKDHAIQIAWDQARQCYGRALELVGVPTDVTASAPSALAHLVEAAVQRLYGSRAAGKALAATAPTPAQPAAASA